MPHFRWIGPYMGISDPKNFKNPKFCKLIRPVWVNPSIDIHEIYKFYAPMGSTEIFQVWCHSVPNWGSYRQKTRIGQFSPIFRGPRAQELWVRSEKVRGCKNGTDVLYAHAKFGEDRLDARRQEMKQCCFLFVHVCLYVCHAGCPGKRSRRSTTYNVTVCRAISMLLSTERNQLSNRLQRFQIYH